MLTDFIELIETTSRVSIEALLNGLWQGVALTALIWSLVRFAPRLSPRGRFAIWLATLTVIVGLPFVTGQKLLPPAMAKYFIAGTVTGTERSLQTPENPLTGQKATFADYTNEAIEGQSASGPITTKQVTHNASPQLAGAVRARQISSEEPPPAHAGVTGAEDVLQTVTTPSSENALFSFVLSRSGALLCFGVWLLISVALLLRLACSYFRLQELQTSAGEAPEALGKQFARWMERQGLRRNVRLLVSSEISAPLAVGFGSPAVILPRGILERLSSHELDLVFVHELAHLKRRDDWSVFWQQVTQALFFVNPAIIWIARRMNLERELACDNEVVSFLGSPRKYAACLTRLAELSAFPCHSALAAGTFVRKNHLLSRVERLLSGVSFGNRRTSRFTVMVTFTVLALALAQFTLTPAVVAVEEPASGFVVISPETPDPEILASATGIVTGQSLDASAKRNEELRRRAQDRVAALESKLASIDDSATVNTSERRAKIAAYQKALEKYERQLARLSESLDRLSASRRKVSSRGYFAPAGVAAIKSAPGAHYVYPPVSTGSNSVSSGYSYYYPAPEVSAPSVSVTALSPAATTVSASEDAGRSSSGVVVYSDRNGNTKISIPGFSIDGDGSWSLQDEDGELTYQWSEGRHKIRVRARGEIQFTDDESDILSISEEGYFDVRERDRRFDREYEVLADENGELDKTYYEDGRRSDLDKEAKRWVQETILFVLRNSSIGAAERAARILEKDGVDGVLAEIDEIETDHVKRVYYSALFSSGKLSGDQTRELITGLAHNLDSDYEKSQALAELDEQALEDDKTLAAYVEAVNTLDSDYQKRRSLATVLSRRDIPKSVALGLLRSAEGFESDYERAELLKSLAEGGLAEDDVVDAYAEAIAGINSDYEKRRALSAITDRPDLSRETVLAILKMAQDIGSDYERAELLTDMYRYTRDDDVYADAYYDAIVDIDSNYEKRRVLSKLLQGRKISETLALKILQLAQTIDSDYERTELLVDMSRLNEGNLDFYRAYVAALGDIDSDYEAHRALNKLDLDKTTPNPVLLDVLSIIDGFDSDYEKAGALKEFAPLYTGDDTLYDAFIEVVEGIDSNYERDRVYASLYKADRASNTKSRRKHYRRNRDGRD